MGHQLTMSMAMQCKQRVDSGREDMPHLHSTAQARLPPCMNPGTNPARARGPVFFGELVQFKLRPEPAAAVPWSAILKTDSPQADRDGVET